MDWFKRKISLFFISTFMSWVPFGVIKKELFCFETNPKANASFRALLSAALAELTVE